MVLLCLFYSWVNWGVEKLSNVSIVSQAVKKLGFEPRKCHSAVYTWLDVWVEGSWRSHSRQWKLLYTGWKIRYSLASLRNLQQEAWRNMVIRVRRNWRWKLAGAGSGVKLNLWLLFTGGCLSLCPIIKHQTVFKMFHHVVEWAIWAHLPNIEHLSFLEWSVKKLLESRRADLVSDMRAPAVPACPVHSV